MSWLVIQLCQSKTGRRRNRSPIFTSTSCCYKTPTRTTTWTLNDSRRIRHWPVLTGRMWNRSRWRVTKDHRPLRYAFYHQFHNLVFILLFYFGGFSSCQSRVRVNQNGNLGLLWPTEWKNSPSISFFFFHRSNRIWWCPIGLLSNQKARRNNRKRKSKEEYREMRAR